MRQPGNNVHLKEDAPGVFFLWGGPINCQSDNFKLYEWNQNRDEIVFLKDYWERDCDDGKTWRRELIFVGVPIVMVKSLGDSITEVQLATGGWITLEGECRELRDRAYICGILNPDIQLPAGASSAWTVAPRVVGPIWYKTQGDDNWTELTK